ncbi:hypothetical protein AND4_05569 [Vibrio sp. AND4]|nr:hypothetical protein AND4_05569 [Vibrio sp. AND4]
MLYVIVPERIEYQLVVGRDNMLQCKIAQVVIHRFI